MKIENVLCFVLGIFCMMVFCVYCLDNLSPNLVSAGIEELDDNTCAVTITWQQNKIIGNIVQRTTSFAIPKEKLKDVCPICK